MFIVKLSVISIFSIIFLFGGAISQDGLIKTLAKQVRNTVDNAVDLVDAVAGPGLVGNVLKGAGDLAKVAMDGAEKIVSEADDHLGDAARAAHHSLISLLQLGNETMKDLREIVQDAGLGVKGIASDTLGTARNVTGALKKML